MTNHITGDDKNKFLFSFLIMSYQSNALIHLGKLKDPVTQKQGINLEHAKLSIDILEMLQEKTKNNLNADESALLLKTLNELRIEYIKQSGAKT